MKGYVHIKREKEGAINRHVSPLCQSKLSSRQLETDFIW